MCVGLWCSWLGLYLYVHLWPVNMAYCVELFYLCRQSPTFLFETQFGPAPINYMLAPPPLKSSQFGFWSKKMCAMFWNVREKKIIFWKIVESELHIFREFWEPASEPITISGLQAISRFKIWTILYRLKWVFNDLFTWNMAINLKEKKLVFQYVL